MTLHNLSSDFKSGEINSCRLSPLSTMAAAAILTVTDGGQGIIPNVLAQRVAKT